jgi:hypothetical protein
VVIAGVSPRRIRIGVEAVFDARESRAAANFGPRRYGEALVAAQA